MSLEPTTNDYLANCDRYAHLYGPRGGVHGVDDLAQKVPEPHTAWSLKFVFERILKVIRGRRQPVPELPTWQ
jgi:hypothetical protein